VETCSEKTSCNPQNCRRACAQEVIDALLREHGSVRGEEVDLLLDLRWLVRHREQPENTLRLFCELRRRLEEKHYLLFYRLRRWLENQLEVVIPTVTGTIKAPLKLEFYCLEAVRAGLVRQARQNSNLLRHSKVDFAFKAMEPVAVS
jgi:hypothetical protein